MENKNKYRKMLKSFVSNIWYVVALVAICTIVIFLIANWSNTMKVIGHFISVMMPFIIGFFLAYLINPLVNKIEGLFDHIRKGEKKKIKKGASVFISYVIVIGIITILIVYIFPQIKDSVKELGSSMKKGYHYVIYNQAEVNKKIPFLPLGDILEYIKENLFGNIVNHSSKIFPYVYELSSSFFSLLYTIFFGIVISIYIVWDKYNLVNNLRKVIYALSPKGKADGVWKTIKQCNHIFNGFLFGKAIDSLIIGILCLIAMSILHLPFALLLSVIVCITNMIPYFGPFIGAIPGVLIYLFIDPKLSLIFAIMILILQQFDGLYLGPKILGDLTGIKPLWVIFGITIGGAYFGVMGMFLGVPTVAVLMYLINLFLDKKLKKKNVQLPDVK